MKVLNTNEKISILVNELTDDHILVLKNDYNAFYISIYSKLNHSNTYGFIRCDTILDTDRMENEQETIAELAKEYLVNGFEVNAFENMVDAMEYIVTETKNNKTHYEAVNK